MLSSNPLSATALIWTWIAAGFVLFLAVNFAYALRKMRSQAGSNRHWPHVKGEVVVSAVQGSASPSGEDAADCHVALAYRYRVAGKEYRGTRIRAGREAPMSRVAAEALAARYPVGAQVEVYYRADKRGTSLLEPKRAGHFAAITVFLMVATFAALILVGHGIAGRVLLVREGGVPLFAFILPFAAIGIAAAALYEFCRLRRLLHESAAWPTAPGRIVQSRVVEEDSTSTDDDGNETTTTKFRPHIRFSYRAEGRELESSRWNWGWTSLYPDEERPRAIIARYTPGTAVSVRYDPKDPENAVLEPGDRQGTMVPLIVAIVFGAAGALMLWGFMVLHN